MTTRASSADLLAGLSIAGLLLPEAVALASPRLSVLGRVGAHDYVSVERFPNAVTVPGMLVLRPEVPLFFANAEPLLAQARQRVLTAPDTRLVVFSLEESPDLDRTALEALVRAKLAHLPTTALDYPSVDDAVRGQGVSPNQLLRT
jgi:MFS superfamily sulfate permease-like transporter